MINKNAILKAVCILAGLAILVSCLTRVHRSNSMSLQDYANENPALAYSKPAVSESSSEINPENDKIPASTEATEPPTENLQETTEVPVASTLIGASLNGESVKDQRITYEEGFFYEPLSDNLRRYITGVSFPAVAISTENTGDLEISYDDLRYLQVLHYDFDGNLAKGELICNKDIAQDLVEIFCELYHNGYQIEKVRLIDEYDGDDNLSMEDNNTSCFNYRVVENSTSLSKHALGLAIDINPLYNPYITYGKNGEVNVAPVSAEAYADRDIAFPYKIDENDLCYRLFKEHGFTWGGDWNSCKDYQHFQKTK